MTPSFGVMDRPGYRILHFVREFLETPAGSVPSVATGLHLRDWLGACGTRLGLRTRYAVVPGLYAVGRPSDASPVLVTANYKLSFDSLRRELAGLDLWILAVETMGVNVWCAAGKGSFSTEAVVASVRQSGLERVVAHRKLLLPQLAAPGVAALEVRRQTGFAVEFGPVRARDIPAFLQAGKATPEMRLVDFPLRERLVLIPVELVFLGRPLLYAMAVLGLLSVLVPWLAAGEGLSDALARGLEGLYATLAGVLAGGALAPAALPWLPSRYFAVKGAVAGLAVGALWLALHETGQPLLADGSLLLWMVAVSSYLCMNFTGSTPYTSPSGVEREMRTWLPWQIGGAAIAVLGWFAAPFI